MDTSRHSGVRSWARHGEGKRGESHPLGEGLCHHRTCALANAGDHRQARGIGCGEKRGCVRRWVQEGRGQGSQGGHCNEGGDLAEGESERGGSGFGRCQLEGPSAYLNRVEWGMGGVLSNPRTWR